MTGAPASDKALDARRRRAKFRAWHRGMVEADLLLGRFADAYIATLCDRDLADFEALLEAPDPDIFDWITGAGSPPPPYVTPLLTRLIAFHAQKP